MDNIDLLQRMKADDQTAFDTLFHLHYEELVRFIYKKTYDQTVAEDIVQGVFINFWVKRKDINIQTSILAYLKTTCKNRFIDHFRKEKSIRTREDVYGHNTLKLDITNPEQALLQKENVAAIYQKIEALPLKCKTVFKLSRFENKSYAEIAEELQISVKTVESHISTALRILRKSIFSFMILFFGF